MKDWNKIFLLTSSTRLISPANARECKLEMLHFLKEKYFSSISKCCTFCKKSISQVFLNVALPERKVFLKYFQMLHFLKEKYFELWQSDATEYGKIFLSRCKVSWRRRLKHLQEICFGRVIAEEWNREWPVAGCGHWVCMQEKLSKGGSLHVLHVSYYMHNSCSKADMPTEGSSSCTNFFSVCMMLCAVPQRG